VNGKTTRLQCLINSPPHNDKKAVMKI
jgi:hypothetical protein